jgi:hypothetical protein
MLEIPAGANYPTQDPAWPIVMNVNAPVFLSLIEWLIRAEVVVFFAGLFGLIGYQIVTRKINTRYLLYGTRSDGTKYFSPERIQLLVLTVIVAFTYLMKLIHNPSGGFPDIDKRLVQILAGSNGIYLGGKSWTMLFRRLLFERN